MGQLNTIAFGSVDLQKQRAMYPAFDADTNSHNSLRLSMLDQGSPTAKKAARQRQKELIEMQEMLENQEKMQSIERK